MKANDLPRVAAEVRLYQVSPCQLVKLAFCPSRHSRCEQLAHSCYAVTGFGGIRAHVFQTPGERTIYHALVHHATGNLPHRYENSCGSPSTCRYTCHLAEVTSRRYTQPVKAGIAWPCTVAHRHTCTVPQ